MQQKLTAESIIKAYCMGIFPMGDDDGQIKWYSPDPRCIIDLDLFHVPARLARTLKQGRFKMNVNSAWRQVLLNCANRETTWINEQIYEAYTQLHQMGLAHSIEAFLDGQLVGGLYGVSLGGAFMGESMFHTATDASKACLVFLVERLRQKGFILLDTQFQTEHLSTFGARNISRQEYLTRLHDALMLKCRFD